MQVVVCPCCYLLLLLCRVARKGSWGAAARPLTTLTLTLALTLLAAEALYQPACCTSRLTQSRVAVRRAALCMCEAAVEEPAAAEEAAPVEAAAEAPAPRRERKAKTPLTELEVGAEVEGKIRSVMSYGAFVDIGAATDGLLHVSEICNEFIKDANEKLTAGESVTCKIKAINMEKNQLALTCKEPQADRPRKKRADLSKYEGADAQAFVTGKVNSITDFGAFVTLEEGVDGLVHISAIQDGGVSSVSDVLSVGQEVQVRIVSFDKGKRRIGLSMKPWVEGEVGGRAPRRGRDDDGGGFGGMGMGDADFKLSEEELEALTVEDEGEPVSSFEAAFQRAAFVQKTKASGGKYAAQRL